MALFQSPYPNNSRTVSGTVTVYQDDVFILADTSSAPVNINLLPIVSGYINVEYRLYVKDISGNASTNNITIIAPTGFKINGEQSFTINQNNVALILVITSNTDYFIFSDLTTRVFANAAARALATPDFIGQLGVQLDTFAVYVGTSLVAGGWTPIKATRTFADATARSLAVADFVGQFGCQLDNNTAYVSINITAGGWVAVSGGGGGSTFTNATPMPSALGGYPAGTSFPTPQTMQQMWDGLLYPYQAPAFTSFSISGQSTSLEAGDTVAGGARTFVWTTSNPTNINANSIAIKDVTGAVTLGSGLANDGTESLNIGAAKTFAVPATYTWSIEATNSQSTLFSTTFSVNWYYRLFTGTSANTTLTESQIEALVNNPLASGFAGTYSFVAGDYKYLCYPDSFGSPTAGTGFKDSSTNLAVDMATVSDNAFYSNVQNGWYYGLVSVTNGFGATTNYRVYRTRNTLGGTITIIVS